MVLPYTFAQLGLAGGGIALAATALLALASSHLLIKAAHGGGEWGPSWKHSMPACGTSSAWVLAAAGLGRSWAERQQAWEVGMPQLPASGAFP